MTIHWDRVKTDLAWIAPILFAAVIVSLPLHKEVLDENRSLKAELAALKTSPHVVLMGPKPKPVLPGQFSSEWQRLNKEAPSRAPRLVIKCEGSC